MPDWTYQPLFRPLLFALGPQAGRDVAVGSLSRLARLPLGTRVVHLMGHAAPDTRLAVERCGIRFPAPVGLGCRFDPHATALRGLEHFGCGFVEVGPVVVGQTEPAGSMTLDRSAEAVRLASPRESVSLDDVLARIESRSRPEVPLFVRLRPEETDEAEWMWAALRTHAAAVVVDLDRLGFVAEFRIASASADEWTPRVLVSVSPAEWGRLEVRNILADAIEAGSVDGLLIDEPVADDGSLVVGGVDVDTTTEVVHDIRAELGSDILLVAGTGVGSPREALTILDAGADLLAISAGLVFAGPGLPKRINAAVRHAAEEREAARVAKSAPVPFAVGSRADDRSAQRAATFSWLWTLLMGVGMWVGGVMALVIASTRVVMPYDEAMCGLTREQLAAINPNLLPFMQHDRVTLAGTMLAVGILYGAGSWCGVRRGLHWPAVAIIASAFAGFFSFFSFLGFGYFDPFHAFVTAVLLQFLLLALHARPPSRARKTIAPELDNDATWKRGLWGQLLFVAHGVALVVAGLVISTVGMTEVFVQEDLDFMSTTREALAAVDGSLIPLVAHDRATFGGMLVSIGVWVVCAGLWGFARGDRWLWWSLLVSGTVAYSATIVVHHAVGYVDLLHLLPAYAGLLMTWVACGLCYGHLCGVDSESATASEVD